MAEIDIIKINNKKTQLEDIIDNVPRVVSENVILTIPASTITEKKTEIDNANEEEPVIISLDGNVNCDPTKTYYLKYNNKEYSLTYTEGALAVLRDECYCGFMFDETNSTFMIISLDTTNITDVQLIEKDINKLDNLFMPENLEVDNSITVGLRVGTVGNNSSSLGYGCESSGQSSHAEGSFTKASGEDSHAEGLNTKALGERSHAEGDGTTASANKSHAEGYKTIASGTQSHSEGYRTTASGNQSHSEGGSTIASGNYSHVEGYNTTASGKYQHVQGKYNIEDGEDKYAHIVGNGSSLDDKSNAHTLDWEGNAWYAGKLSQEGTPTEDKDLTTKKYVDTSLNNKVDKSQLSFNSDGELVVTIDGISKIFVPKA